MTPGLAVERLTVEREGRLVLRDLSFHLAPGAAIVVTGSNGAGKSTLLRAVAGLIPRIGGAVRFAPTDDSDAITLGLGPGSPSPLAGEGGQRPDEGAGAQRLRRSPLIPRSAGSSPARGEGDHDRRGEQPDIGDHISYLGHGNGLKLSLTAAENLRFAAAWAGRGGVSAEAALAAVGLGHVADFPARILSAGQRRRVALAGLLVARRPLWLLDEPATALDRTSEALLAGLLHAHLEGGGLVLAAIHAPLGLPARELRLGAA